jgi:hypothetical protein
MLASRSACVNIGADETSETGGDLEWLFVDVSRNCAQLVSRSTFANFNLLPLVVAALLTRDDMMKEVRRRLYVVVTNYRLHYYARKHAMEIGF